MVDFPEFIRPSLAKWPQESLDGQVEINIVSKGFTWFVLDVQRDNKYCLKESWPDSLCHGLECHLIDFPLSVIDYALMDGISWVVTPLYMVHKNMTGVHQQSKEKGTPWSCFVPIQTNLGKTRKVYAKHLLQYSFYLHTLGQLKCFLSRH